MKKGNREGDSKLMVENAKAWLNYMYERLGDNLFISAPSQWKDLGTYKEDWLLVVGKKVKDESTVHEENI